MIRPGPLNLLTDVDGLLVGNVEDRTVRSGVTVVLADPDAVAAVDCRGGAPGTRETDALQPTSLVERVHAITLSGGSAFGLGAADGVIGWLAARRRGFSVGTACVPVVPAAILFDLLNGGDKAWGPQPPYRELAERACGQAGSVFQLGNVGAGFGAKAGPYKGGLGSASAILPDGPTVAALIAVNAVGSPVIPGQAAFWAWPWEQNREFGGIAPQAGGGVTSLDTRPSLPETPGTQTTIGVVATDAALTRAEAQRVAMMAQDGIARALVPAHTPFDGDTLFVLATGRKKLPKPRAQALCHLGAAAADTVTRAIARGVWCAESLGDMLGYRESFLPRTGFWPEDPF